MDTYFAVRREDRWYVAYLCFEKPEDGKDSSSSSIKLGQILCACLPSPVQLKAWCDAMSDAHDALVRGAAEAKGLKTTQIQTDQIVDRIPGVH